VFAERSSACHTDHTTCSIRSSRPHICNACRVARWRSHTSGTGVARGCGLHRAALARGDKRATIVFLNSFENSESVISYVFACNKNKALQLQRVSVLSILGQGCSTGYLYWYLELKYWYWYLRLNVIVKCRLSVRQFV